MKPMEQESFDLTPELIRSIRTSVADHELDIPFHVSRKELFSRKHFGDLIGVQGGTISNWENGYSLPQPAHRKRIMDLAISVQQEQIRRRNAIRV